MAGLPDVNVEYTLVVTPSCVDNTPATAPLTTAVPQLDQTYLWSMNVRVPPGHAGVTGIAFVNSSQFVIPYAQGSPEWITDDDAQLSFAYQNSLGVGSALYYYNTSTQYTHGWQIRFIYTPLSALVSQGDSIVVPNLQADAAAIEATTGGS